MTGRVTGLLAAGVLAATATSAQAFTIARPVARSGCALHRVSGAGAQTQSYTVPAASTLTFALHGGASSDWDLAVFDHESGRRLGGSGAWGADEVVQVLARTGQRLDVQACRVSGRARTLPLQVTSAALPKDVPAVKQMLVRIQTPSATARRLLAGLGLDLGEDATRAGVSAIIHGAQQLALLKKLGLPFQIVVDDLAAKDREDRAADRAYGAQMRQAGGSPLPSGRTSYRQLEDYYAELKKLAQDHPAIVRPVTLPKTTFQGRDQAGVEISSNVNATDDQKPVAFIMGLHHAREWPAAEAPMELAYYLVQRFGSDQEVTDLLNRTRVVIVPIINPDGFVASRTSFSVADSIDPTGAFSTVEAVGLGGTLAYRRKNCHGSLPASAPCVLQLGVDPNRNYGFNWGGFGASTDPTSQTYRGSAPFSEAETQSVHAYSQVHDITSLLTMHNVAALVLRPPGVHTEGMAPDEPALKALGDAMGADTGYTSEYGYQLYDTSGTTEDWNYGAAGTFGYTIEMGPAGGDFHMPYQVGVVDQWTGTANQAGRGVRQAMLRMIAAATDKAQFATLAGRAAPGRILRVKRAFQTSTSPVCAIADPLPIDVAGLGAATDCLNPGAPILFDDKLEYTAKVPANGNFSWLVTPSTAPFMHRAGNDTAWTLTCEDDAGKVYESKQVTIWRGETQTFTLPCGGKLVPLAAAAPHSKITRRSLLATRRALQLAGTATDAKRVEVAVGLRSGTRCRFLRAKGGYGPTVSCKRGSFLPAHGTKTWTLVLTRRLRPGRYVAWARAVGATGKHEARHGVITFRVR